MCRSSTGSARRSTSTFRPQEAFSTQVLDAAVRALNRERPQAVVVTGDIVDSAQENELDLALAVLAAASSTPDSGGPRLRRRAGGEQPRPVLLPPRQRRAAPSRACSTPRSAGSAPTGLRRAVVPGDRQPRRARAGRGAGDARRSSGIATGDEMVVGIDPRVAAAARRGERPGGRQRAARHRATCSGAARPCPPTRGAGTWSRARWRRGWPTRPACSRPASRLDYAFDIGASRARDRARHGRSHGRLATAS